jgi:hypothetical protein
MKRLFTGSCVLAVSAFAFSAGAQQPTQPPQTPPATPPTEQAPAKPDTPYPGKDATIKGCLQAGAGADSFVLANVARVPTGAPGAPGAPAAAAGAEKKSVNLKAADATVDLKAHVGHTVEVTGSFIKAAAGAMGEAAGAGKRDKSFEVKSVSMISPTCESGTE